MSEAAATALASWLKVEPDEIRARVSASELEALSRKLRPSEPGRATRTARAAAGKLLPALPLPVRRAASTAAKRVRETLAPSTEGGLSELAFVALARRLAAELERPLPSPGRVEVSHDVDWKTCYAFVPELAALEKARGIRSTFLFLTGDAYRVDRSLISDLLKEGFLVGVHGVTHDVAIGWRERAAIRDELETARDALGFEAKVYRAPGLGVTRTLLEVLDSLQFEVDGSLRVQARSKKGAATGTIWPFRIEGLALEERPLAIQDDALFRDRRLTDEAALALVSSAMAEVTALGGTFVWNAHPTLAQEHRAFTEAFTERAALLGARAFGARASA